MIVEVVLIALTVNENDPRSVGVPESTPFELKEVPVGSAPDRTEYPVANAFVAERVREYATDADVFASVGAVVQVGTVATSMLKLRSAVAFVADPVARTVQEYAPETVGVPLRSPAPERDRPVGRDPDDTAKVRALVAESWTDVMAPPWGASAYAPPAVIQTGSGTVVCVNVLSA
jgi:hypothetical protein